MKEVFCHCLMNLHVLVLSCLINKPVIQYVELLAFLIDLIFFLSITFQRIQRDDFSPEESSNVYCIYEKYEKYVNLKEKNNAITFAL